MRISQLFGFVIGAMLMSGSLHAEMATVAVASNFTAPAKTLKKLFESQSEHQIRLVFGSSGKLYAQIKHGAPFQLFLSADQAKPKALIKEALAIEESRYTYAQGRIVLWSLDHRLIDKTAEVLEQQSFRKLAVANAKLAPYGLGAQQVLKAMSLYEVVKNKIVIGENIAQAYQFVRSENAELGFVAASQVYEKGKLKEGSAWLVPSSMHDPINQDMVRLKHANEAAKAFEKFIKSEAASALIKSYGYESGVDL